MISKPAKPSPFQRLEIKTSWGPITLTLEGGKVVGCTLPFLKATPRKEFSLLGGTRPPGAFKACAERPLHPTGFQSLEDLLKKFPNLGKLEGTDFQKAVWNELKKIPRGQTRTYREVAKAIKNPKAMRAVGTACGANPVPLFIPCHRVVAQNGLGGFGAGLPWKNLLLKLEGWNEGTVE